jgi:signal transduction histidine kinase
MQKLSWVCGPCWLLLVFPVVSLYIQTPYAQSAVSVGLALLIALLTNMTWRQLRFEPARRASFRRFRALLQPAYDALERRVEERTAAWRAANASLQREIAEHQRTAQEMLEISNREQRRIGQDLHDGLGQLLTGIAFLSQALAQKLAAQAMAEAMEATQVVQLANQAMTWTRELVRGLSPIEVQGDGFIPALQDLATQTELLFGITCRVTCDRPPPMQDHTVAMHLYRIAQEAVSNAVKHGLARHVVLALTTVHHHTTLTVHDDGIGFPDVSEKPTGMGLRIMHYRASMIGAALTIQSDASGGTRVVCVWPHSPRGPNAEC